MRKMFLWFVAILLVFGYGINSASAIIFLSGDSSIINPIEPSNYGVSVDPGNQQFFKNILQGGTSVLILQGETIGATSEFYSHLTTFYSGLGATATLISGTVTGAQLTGVNLFIAPVPTDAFNASEITALNNFLNGGGSIFFLGENDYWFSNQNGYINDALAALGSSLSIVNAQNDMAMPTFPTATGSQIAADPFTAGVTTFTYAWTSDVAGGTYLFFDLEGQPFVEYGGATGAVPEPATMLLLGSGLIGLAGYGRKKFFKK
jgi:hypothetical protein